MFVKKKKSKKKKYNKFGQFGKSLRSLGESSTFFLVHSTFFLRLLSITFSTHYRIFA